MIMIEYLQLWRRWRRGESQCRRWRRSTWSLLQRPASRWSWWCWWWWWWCSWWWGHLLDHGDQRHGGRDYDDFDDDGDVDFYDDVLDYEAVYLITPKETSVKVVLMVLLRMLNIYHMIEIINLKCSKSKMKKNNIFRDFSMTSSPRIEPPTRQLMSISLKVKSNWKVTYATFSSEIIFLFYFLFFSHSWPAV